MKTVFLAIAAALIGAGNGLQSFANDGNVPEGATGGGGDGGGSGDAPKRGRGRPAGSGKTDGGGAGDGGGSGPSNEERLEKNKALIKPLVDGGSGEEVKKVIAKYSKTGLKDLPADKQADFEKDIDALTY